MRTDRDRHGPDDRPFSRDGAPLQGVAQLRNNGFGGARNIRGPRLLTIGEHPQRRIRPNIPPPDLETTFPSVTFLFDPANRSNTYYYTPSDYALNPGRTVPASVVDPTWSTTDTGKQPIILGSAGPPSIAVPEFDFSTLVGSAVEGTYDLTCQMSLLDADGNVLTTFAYQANMSFANGASAAYFNVTLPSFGIDTPVSQFYAILVTWSGSASLTNYEEDLPSDWFTGMAAAKLTWITPVLLEPGARFKSVWKTEHTIPSLTANLISQGNVSYKTDIVWTNPDNHTVKFPWHYVPNTKLRGRPRFWYNNQSQSLIGVNSTLSLNLSLVTVDASGADVDSLILSPFGNPPYLDAYLGFQELQGTLQQVGEACGFYLQITPIIPIDSGVNIWSFLTPMRIWWTVDNVT